MTRLTLALALSLPYAAHAVPLNLTNQGYLQNANGVGLNGVHTLQFSLYDDASATNPAVWTESLTVDVDDGVYSVVLGTTSTIDETILDQYPLYLGLSVDSGGDLLPRHEVVSSPFAILAETSVNVDGGTVNATDVTVGTTVIDGNGLSVNGGVIVNGGGHINAASLSVNGMTIVDGSGGFVGSPPVPADLGCLDGELMVWDDTGGTWACGVEDDPDFDLSPAAGITSGDLTAWDATFNYFDATDAPAAGTIGAAEVASWNTTATTVTGAASTWDGTATTVSGAGLTTTNYNNTDWDTAYGVLDSTDMPTAGDIGATEVASWNATATSVAASESSWTTATATVTNSGLTGTNYNNADWDAAYGVFDSGDMPAAGDISATDIASWNAAATDVSVLAATWTSAANTVSGSGLTSANYNNADWDSAYATVTNSGLTDTNYNHTSWDSTAATVSAGSGSWDSTAATVSSGSGSWDSTAATVTAGSGSWDSTAAAVTAGSGSWDSTAATVATGSSSWDTAAATVSASSATWDAKVDINESRTFNLSGDLDFDNRTDQRIHLWNAEYGIGIQSSTQYFRTGGGFAWFQGGVHDDAQNNPGGGSVLMTVDAGGLDVPAPVTIDGEYVDAAAIGAWDDAWEDYRTRWRDLPNLVPATLPGDLGSGYVHASVGNGVEASTCYDWALPKPIPVDPAKSYEFSAFIQTDDTEMDNYIGFHAFDADMVRITTDGMNNPYFKVGQDDAPTWTRFSGRVLRSSALDANNNGVADVDVAATNGTDYVMPPQTAYLAIRYGSCYSPTLNGTTLFALPEIREVDDELVHDVQVDTTNRSFDTNWALGPTFNTISGFQAGSKVRISYHMPLRNESASWGGGYIEPQISINGGAWQSLGSSGYDGAVMNFGGAAIGSYGNTLLIDPAQTSDFSVALRFYLRAYDGTLLLNLNHSVNSISTTAPLMAGVNGTQHYSKVIVDEVR